MGENSSYLRTSLLPSNIMPSNQNESVNTSESWLNVASIIPKSVVNSNAEQRNK